MTETWSLLTPFVRSTGKNRPFGHDHRDDEDYQGLRFSFTGSDRKAKVLRGHFPYNLYMIH